VSAHDDRVALLRRAEQAARDHGMDITANDFFLAARAPEWQLRVQVRRDAEVAREALRAQELLDLVAVLDKVTGMAIAPVEDPYTVEAGVIREIRAALGVGDPAGEPQAEWRK
jgi:hypothetical protein